MLKTPLEISFDAGIVAPFVEFKEGTVLVASDFCKNCVHPNGDKKLIRLCEKHWDENLKKWAKLNAVEL